MVFCGGRHCGTKHSAIVLRIRRTVATCSVLQLISQKIWVAEWTIPQVCLGWVESRTKWVAEWSIPQLKFPAKWVAEWSIPQLSSRSVAQLRNASFCNSFCKRRNPSQNYKPYQIPPNTLQIQKYIIHTSNNPQMRCYLRLTKWKWPRKRMTERWLCLEVAPQKWNEERFMEKWIWGF